MPKAGAYRPVAVRGSMDWMTSAACLDADPRLFDELPRGAKSYTSPEVAKAKQICAGCPVRAECLAFGAVNRETGVRGGEYLTFGKTAYSEPIIEGFDPERHAA